MTRSIFISYRRGHMDRHAAGRLHLTLREAFGADSLFMDVSALQPGVNFVKELQARVAEARVMLVVIGRDWLATRERLADPKDFVRIEIENALKAAQQDETVVIPVLLDGVDASALSGLPDTLGELADIQAWRLSHDTFEADASGLIATLKKHVKPAARSWLWRSGGKPKPGTKAAAITTPAAPPDVAASAPGRTGTLLAGALAAAGVVAYLLLSPIDFVLYRLTGRSQIAWEPVATYYAPVFDALDDARSLIVFLGIPAAAVVLSLLMPARGDPLRRALVWLASVPLLSIAASGILARTLADRFLAGSPGALSPFEAGNIALSAPALACILSGLWSMRGHGPSGTARAACWLGCLLAAQSSAPSLIRTYVGAFSDAPHYQWLLGSLAMLAIAALTAVWLLHRSTSRTWGMALIAWAGLAVSVHAALPDAVMVLGSTDSPIDSLSAAITPGESASLVTILALGLLIWRWRARSPRM